MTGPEHYAEAERLLAAAGAASREPYDDAARAAAQVHATLALAAATMDAATLAASTWTDRDHVQWTGATLPSEWGQVMTP